MNYLKSDSLRVRQLGNASFPPLDCGCLGAKPEIIIEPNEKIINYTTDRPQ